MNDLRSAARPPTITIPTGAGIRLTMLPPAIIVTPSGGSDLATPGTVAAVLGHDPGVTWPDRRGIGLADAVLESGGTVCFEFASLADAFTFRARLLREAGR